LQGRSNSRVAIPHAKSLFSQPFPSGIATASGDTFITKNIFRPAKPTHQLYVHPHSAFCILYPEFHIPGLILDLAPPFLHHPRYDELTRTMFHRFLISLALALSSSIVACAQGDFIRPGEIWPDDRGQHIQAHGGGIIRLDSTYYWFGEDRSRDLDPQKRYVACYSSIDLTHWKFRNRVLQLADPENFGPRWILERPKVFYCQPTKKYVMYMHIDGPSPGRRSGYDLARVGLAVCDTVDGDYQYLRSFRPLGNQSRDLGQFIDDDGAAYLISEDRPNGFHIYRLAEDYLSIDRDTCLVPAHLEGGAIVHFGGLYYTIGSELTSWNPNPNKYATAARLEGPWSDFKDIAPPDTKTYGSQSTMLLKVVGTKHEAVLFLADIWKPQTQWDSRYLWMPLEIGAGKLQLPKPQPWSIDVETGEVTIKDSDRGGEK